MIGKGLLCLGILGLMGGGVLEARIDPMNPRYSSTKSDRQETSGRGSGDSARRGGKSGDFKAAYQAYYQGDYARSSKMMADLLSRNAQGKDIDQAYVLAALSYQGLGDMDNAINCLDRLIYQNTASPYYKSKAWVVKGNIYYNQNSWDRALHAYDEAMKGGVTLEEGGMVLDRLGDMYARQGDADKAKMVYGRILQEYPASPEAKMAQQKMMNVNSMNDDIAPLGSSQQSCYVQAGAFQGMQNADKLKKQLRLQGYQASVASADKKGQTIYKVRIGPFSRASEAEAAVKKLQSTNNIKGSVVTDNIKGSVVTE